MVLSEPALYKPDGRSPYQKSPKPPVRNSGQEYFFESQEVFSQQNNSPRQEKASPQAEPHKLGTPKKSQADRQQELAKEKLIAEKLQLIPESHFFSEKISPSKPQDSQSPSHIDYVVKRKLKKLQIKEVFTNLYFD